MAEFSKELGGAARASCARSRTQALIAHRRSRIEEIACATFALLLPALCAAQCKSAVETVKVKFEASEEADTHLLVEKLNKQGCGHGLRFEPADQGFVYRILLVNTTKPRTTFSMAGAGTTDDPIVLITVYDDKGTELFDFARSRAIRITHKGTVNASAKEIIKRLVRMRSHK
jgi:hypothetical protein